MLRAVSKSERGLYTDSMQLVIWCRLSLVLAIRWDLSLVRDCLCYCKVWVISLVLHYKPDSIVNQNI